MEKYYQTVAGLTDYYRKYAGYSPEYAAKLVDNAETMIGGDISVEEALTYSHDIMTGLIYLNEAGKDVELPYLRGMFNLARAYTLNDSVTSALDLYRQCLAMNEMMFKDTAVTTYKGNMAEVYGKIANCYEMMAEDVDTAHSELWYYRAIDARDTLIDLLKELSNDGDVNKTYRAAVQYKNNAMVFYRLEMIPSAQDYLDKSIELLKMLYNSEYKTEVEEDVILHYYLKGYIYAENNNNEKAVENLRIAVDYGDKSDTSEGVSRYYFMAVNELIELLSRDTAANAAEIAKLTKTQKALKKFF
jgi:tetratricopeptide (TPR) repeat protein